MAKSAKKRTVRSKHPPAPRKNRHEPHDTSSAEAKTRPGTKQARAIEMLGSKQGASSAALMEATGWQPHSVRGFLAGVVRRRLKLDLISTVDAGVRTYRITGAAAAQSSKAQGVRSKSS